MDYCLLQSDALNFFLSSDYMGGLYLTLIFSMHPPPQIFQRNHKVHLSNCLETNFRDIPNISLRDIRRGNYS